MDATSKKVTPLFDNQMLLLDYKALSKATCIPVGTLQKWVHRKQIPFQKFGHLVRFSPKVIEKWLLERQGV